MTAETDRPDERISHPNRGTLGQGPYGGTDHLYLSAEQLHDHENDPSWQAPREKGLSTGRLIALVVGAGIAVLVVLRIVGVI